MALAHGVLEDRPRPGWVRGACAAVVLTVLYVLAVPLGTLPAVAIPHTDHLARGLVAAAGMGIVAVLVLIVAFEVLFTNRRRDLRPYGFARPARLGSTLAIAFPYYVALGIGLRISEALGLTGTTTPDLHDRSSGQKLAISFVAIIVAPWLEETAIRGMLFSSLDGRFGFWAAALASGAFWAALHLEPAVLIPFIAGSVFLSWMRRRSGSLVPGMALHGAQNSLASYIGAGAGWYMAPMPFLLLASLALTWRWLPADPAPAGN